MSRKAQQGTAEYPADRAEAPSGRFSRLRAVPGFRTAAVAFFLTVVLGIGGTAAYAYWQVSTTATISVTPTAAVPKPSPPVCDYFDNIWWSKVQGADKSAVHVITFTVGTVTKSYAMPLYLTGADLSALPGLDTALGSTGGKAVEMTVSRRTAVLKRDVSWITPVLESDLAVSSESAVMSSTKMTYSGKPQGSKIDVSFTCR